MSVIILRIWGNVKIPLIVPDPVAPTFRFSPVHALIYCKLTSFVALRKQIHNISGLGIEKSVIAQHRKFVRNDIASGGKTRTSRISELTPSIIGVPVMPTVLGISPHPPVSALWKGGSKVLWAIKAPVNPSKILMIFALDTTMTCSLVAPGGVQTRGLA